MEVEQERKRRLEADRRCREREREEQRTKKLLAYSRWQVDANEKFYEAVELPTSAEYTGEYLSWMSGQMSIKQEEKPLEYFERMLPSYEEYVRDKYLETPVTEQYSEPVLTEQYCESSKLQRDYDMAVDIIGQGENKEPESQATPQLPVSFSDFKSLSVSTQSQLLCTELCDTMQVFKLLQQYAKDTGYHGSFDELYEMANAISEENIRSYEDKKAQMIAYELIRAGATAQNFYQIKTESLAELFVSVGDIDSSLIPLIIKVEQKLGVEPDYEKNLVLVNAVQNDITKYRENYLDRIR